MDNRIANRIMSAWSVSRLEIQYNPAARNGRWTIRGRCLCNGHPVAHWRVGESHLLGSGDTLVLAAADALGFMKRGQPAPSDTQQQEAAP